MKTSKIVTLRRFPSSQEANIYKSLLESSGIECSLSGVFFHDMLPIGVGGDIELQVNSRDEKKAKQILSAKFDKEELKAYSKA